MKIVLSLQYKKSKNDKMSKQHVQLPNNMIKKDGLEPKDLLIYANIKKYMNNETRECFPSFVTISKDSGYSINTIRNSITLLVSNNYISVRREGKKNIYKFNPYKNFEPFSYDFLESNLEANEKAYILAHQQFFIKDKQGLGKTTYTNEEIAEKLNISPRTVSRLDTSLVRKGYLDIVKTNSKDPVTGVYINEKFFHLDELGQAIIWKLQQHEEDIEELKETTESNSRDLQIVLRENKQMKDELNLIKQLLKENNIEISDNRTEDSITL